ncbi:MAG: tetratricopeptide repeat protein, partial [Candidatus Heimdallarchaeota archaeon]|nr:tetratricopeptide repeat protein [Candidatus Heimdallarchaeota archaeon]
IDPDNVLGYHHLASIYASIANIEEAMKNYEECLTLDPSFIEASISLASLHWASKEYKIALTLLEDAKRFNGLDSRIFQLMGDIQEDTGDLDKAEENWKKASELEEG